MSSAQRWDKDPRYPEKRGVCDCCRQRDNLKLAYDLHKYICINANACLQRLAKLHQKEK